MGFFDKRASGGSRRSFRLLRQRCMTIGIYAVCASLVFACGFGLWKSGSVSKIGMLAASKTYAFTAAAGFKVNEVIVTGRRHVAQDEITERLGIRRGMPMFAIDLAAARENVLQIPWVKGAMISRSLPGNIVVDVTEREPVAFWQHNGKITVIGADGAALSSENLDSYGDLLMVVGADAAQNAVELLGLLQAEPVVAARTSSAVRVGNRRWDLHLKNGMTVMLPEKDSGLALAKLASMESKNKILGRNIVRIDLRLLDRLVAEPGPRKEGDARSDKNNKENI